MAASRYVDALAGDLVHVWQLTLQNADPVGRVTLVLATDKPTTLYGPQTPDGAPAAGALVAAAVTLDGTRAPTGTVTATLAGVDAQVLELFDPMDGVEALVFAGYTAGPGTKETWPLALFVVDRIGTDETGQTVITGATRDAAILDYGRLEQPYIATATAEQHISALATLAGVELVTAVVPSGRLVDLETVEPWQSIEQLMAAEGWHTVADGSDVFVRPSTTAYQVTPAAALHTGPNGTITRRTDERSRDASATIVYAEHAWTDEAGDAHEVTGRARDPIRDRPGNRRAATITSNAPASQAAADRAATAALARMTSRARRLVVETIGAYWLDADSIVDVEPPGYDAAAADMLRTAVDTVTHASDGTSTLVLRPIPDWYIGDVTAAQASINDATGAYATIADLTLGRTKP